jgi:predicted nucleotidyltransferase
MVTQQTALAEAKEFVEELRQSGLDLRLAILFGSFARNEQRQWSDIDMALVASDFSGFRAEDVRLFVRSLVKHVDIEPHTFSPEQFADWNPFVQEIKRTGIVVGEWEPAATENRAIHM